MTEQKIKTLQEQLATIQQSLKVAKNQKNSFGNYYYRSCEDILEAVKPLLNCCTLVISDEVVNIGERYYVKSATVLSNGKETIVCTAYAREALEKKGMDSAQITGSTSSYARKYALNGLFAIDDTKDADTVDNTKEKPKEETPPDPTEEWGKPDEERHYCDMHNKPLKMRAEGVWDHRAKLNLQKEYDENGEWYKCQGTGWFLSM